MTTLSILTTILAVGFAVWMLARLISDMVYSNKHVKLSEDWDPNASRGAIRGRNNKGI